MSSPINIDNQDNNQNNNPIDNIIENIVENFIENYTDNNIIGYKKCGDYCVTLEIPSYAKTNIKRTSCKNIKYAKHRANIVKVIDIEHITQKTKINSVKNTIYKQRIIEYKIGENIEDSCFEDNIDEICAPGIHFFVLKEIACRYSPYNHTVAVENNNLLEYDDNGNNIGILLSSHKFHSSYYWEKIISKYPEIYVLKPNIVDIHSKYVNNFVKKWTDSNDFVGSYIKSINEVLLENNPNIINYLKETNIIMFEKDTNSETLNIDSSDKSSTTAITGFEFRKNYNKNIDK